MQYAIIQVSRAAVGKASRIEPTESGRKTGIRVKTMQKEAAARLFASGAIPRLASPWGPARLITPETPLQRQTRQSALLAEIVYVDAERAQDRAAHIGTPSSQLSAKSRQTRVAKLYDAAKKAAWAWAVAK